MSVEEPESSFRDRRRGTTLDPTQVLFEETQSPHLSSYISHEMVPFISLKFNHVLQWIKRKHRGEKKELVQDQPKTFSDNATYPILEVIENLCEKNSGEVSPTPHSITLKVADISLPAFSNQLSILQQILEKPVFKKKPALADCLMQYALKLAHQPFAQNISSESLKIQTEEDYSLLGKLIFISENASASLMQRIESKSDKGLSEWLEMTFNEEMVRIRQSIKNHSGIHAKTGIQRADIAVQVMFIREISEMLVTSEGIINVGLINAIVKDFPNEFVQSAGMNMITHLTLLKNNPHICEALSSITLPLSLKAPSQKIIQNTLSRTGEKNRDAVVTALTAFLSHLRQGNAGSCFSTFLAINMLVTRPLDCIKDFNSLLSKSALSRNVDGIKIQFPFLLTSMSSSLLEPFHVSPEGEIFHPGPTHAYLWEAPGLISAGNAMEISDLKSSILCQLDKLKKDASPSLKLTPASLLKMISSSTENYERGLAAFEAEESNPLLHAWENAIAGMAETTESSLIKSGINNSTLQILDSFFQKTFPTFTKSTLNYFHCIVNEELNAEIRLQYDPAIPGIHSSQDQHSNTGGFVLYDRNGSSHSNEWIRINSAEEYQQFVIKLCQLAAKRIERDTKESIKWFENLKNFIDSDKFLNEAIKNFHPQNSRLSHPLQVIREIRYTPWLIKGGNNPKKILQVYFESKEAPPTEKFVPSNAHALLEKVIDLAKHCSPLDHDTQGTNPYLMTPVRTPGLHSFSLMLGHPSLAKACEQTDQSSEWIQEHVISPGLEIAKTPADPLLKTKLLNFCLNSLLPSKYTRTFMNLYHQFPPALSVSELRSHFDKALSKANPAIQKTHHDRLRQIDSIIYQSLASDKRQSLEESAVHFADTNWSLGIHDVHFCFVVNPGNGELEVWEVSENGKNLSPIDQATWLNHQEWEIYEPFFLEKEIPYENNVHEKGDHHATC